MNNRPLFFDSTAHCQIHAAFDLFDLDRAFLALEVEPAEILLIEEHLPVVAMV